MLFFCLIKDPPQKKTNKQTKKTLTALAFPCPNWNLPFLSQILNHIVVSQLHAQITSSDMFEPFQSSFHCKYSTDSTFLKVTNKPFVSLGSFSTSAPHSPPPHPRSQHHPPHHASPKLFLRSLNISDTGLYCLRSHLTNRQQYVIINNCTSCITQHSQGDPMEFSAWSSSVHPLHTSPWNNIYYQILNPMYTLTPSPLQLPLTCSITVIKSWNKALFLELNCH